MSVMSDPLAPEGAPITRSSIASKSSFAPKNSFYKKFSAAIIAFFSAEALAGLHPASRAAARTP